MADFVNARVARGRGRLQLERVPYATDLAIAALARFEHIILVNAQAAGRLLRLSRASPRASIRRDAQLHVLSRPDQDAGGGAAGAGRRARRAGGRHPRSGPAPGRGRAARRRPRGWRRRWPR